MPRKTRALIAGICKRWSAILKLTEAPPDEDMDLDDPTIENGPDDDVSEMFISRLESYQSAALTELVGELLNLQAYDTVCGLIDETASLYDGRLRSNLYGDLVQLMGLEQKNDECRDILRKLQMPDRDLFRYWGLLAYLTKDARDYAAAREVMQRILNSPKDPEDHIAYRVTIRIELWKLTKSDDDLQAVRDEIRAQTPIAAVRGQMSLARSLNTPGEYLKAIGMASKLMIATNRKEVVDDIIRDVALAAHYGKITAKADTPHEMREIVKGMTTEEVNEIVNRVSPPLRELIKRRCLTIGVEL